MPRILVFFWVIVAITACKQPRVDATSRTSFEKSMGEILQTVDGKTGIELNRALEYLQISLPLKESDEETWRELHGMNATEILAYSAQAKRLQPATGKPGKSVSVSRVLAVDENYDKTTICGEIFLKLQEGSVNKAAGHRILLFREKTFRESMAFSGRLSAFKAEEKELEFRLQNLRLALSHSKDLESHQKKLDAVRAAKESFFKLGCIDYHFQDPWTGETTELDFHKNRSQAEQTFASAEAIGKSRVDFHAAELRKYCARAKINASVIARELSSTQKERLRLERRESDPFFGLIPSIQTDEPLAVEILDSEGKFCFVDIPGGDYAIFCVFPISSTAVEYVWWCEPVTLPPGGKVDVVLSQSNVKYVSSTLQGSPTRNAVAVED
ncbi:MAG: hypothetical protein PWP23_644 [Candidatus Sumerlaeota bacterium]|nr:hypothetical protein [Candidatus Sumerlaeota bacterium]